MTYDISKTVDTDFSETIDHVIAALKDEGFGIITEVDLKDKFKEKLNVDFRNYKILGACNPKLAYEAIQKEDKIGLMLPCNILVQQQTTGKVEVSAINPLQSIGVVDNDDLKKLASMVSEKLKTVISKI